MNKLYNNEMDIVKGLSSFFENISFKLSKPQAKMVPHIITSIINAENVTTLDISKCYIDDSFLSNQSSTKKKLWRFFNNNKFNDFPIRKHTSLYYEDIELGDFHFKCNLSIAREKLSDDP